MIPRDWNGQIFLCRLLLTQCSNKYTCVPRNPASGRTWWLERSILLKTHFAAKDCTAIKGPIPCYLLSFQKTSIQLNSKNNGPALLSVAIDGKKLRQRLTVLMLCGQNHKKILLWLVLSDETCWALPHNSTRAFCAWVNTQSIILFFFIYFILFATLITKDIGKEEEKK